MSNINPYSPKALRTVPIGPTRSKTFTSVFMVIGCFATALILSNGRYNDTFKTVEVDILPAEQPLLQQADTIAAAIAEAKSIGENKFGVTSPPKEEVRKIRPPAERKTVPKKKKQKVEYLFTGNRMAYIPGNAESFAKAVAPYARQVSAETNIPTSVLIGQTMLESNNGQSKLSLEHNNHFGYKCSEKCRKPGHCVNMADDKPSDRFRHFSNADHAFREYAKLLKLPRYKKAREAKTPYDTIVALKEAGYATDPNYVAALYGVIQRHNLTQYDK